MLLIRTPSRARWTQNGKTPRWFVAVQKVAAERDVESIHGVEQSLTLDPNLSASLGEGEGLSDMWAMLAGSSESEVLAEMRKDACGMALVVVVVVVVPGRTADGGGVGLGED